MKETLKHNEAFQKYYDLGDNRSLEKLLHSYSTDAPNLKSLKNWSVAFGWQERVAEWDKNVILELEKKLKKDFVQDKIHYYNLVKKAASIYQTNLLKGLVKVNSVADFEKLINIGFKLTGEDKEEQMSGTITVKLDDDD